VNFPESHFEAGVASFTNSYSLQNDIAESFENKRSREVSNWYLNCIFLLWNTADVRGAVRIAVAS
jgi:hypothetical protein